MTNKLFSSGRPFVLFFLAAVLLTAVAEILHLQPKPSITSIAANASTILQQAETKALQKADHLTRLHSAEDIREDLLNEPNNNTLIAFACIKDSLFAWSDNDVLLTQEEMDSLIQGTGTLLKLRNGWYEVIKKSKVNTLTGSATDYHFYITLLIKNEFAYQNKYLVNSFNPDLGIPAQYGFSASPVAGAAVVKNKAGQALFYLTPPEKGTTFTAKSSPLPGLYIIDLLLLLGAIYSFGTWLVKKSMLFTIFFALVIAGLRMLMIHFRIPEDLYATELFNPRLYASYIYMNSLGDFLLNVLLVLALLLIFIGHRYGKEVKEYKSIGVSEHQRMGEEHCHTPILLYSHTVSYRLFPLMLAMIILTTIALSGLIRGLVYNSSISFNTNNVFDLSGYSFIGLLIIALLILIYYLLVRMFVELQIQIVENKPKAHLYASLVFISIIILFAISTNLHYIKEYTLLILFYLTILIYSKRDIISIPSPREKGMEREYPLFFTVILVLIAGLYSSVSIYNYSNSKEQEDRKLLAEKVVTEQDRIAEHLFEDVAMKIEADTTLQSYFKNPATTSFMVSQRLHRRYFNGFWTKFDVGSYCFNASNNPFNKHVDSTGYAQFESVIANVGKPTYSENLFFLTNAKGKSLYLARIPIQAASPPKPRSSLRLSSATKGEGEGDDVGIAQSPSLREGVGEKAGTIFIELEPKQIQAEQGFPELFISDKVAYNKELSNYSYAKYKNNELISQYGDFAYWASPPVPISSSEYNFINRDGYNHLVYKGSGGNLIIISRKQNTVYSLITSFSYFFACFSILLLLFRITSNLVRGKFITSLSLKNRIQIAVSVVVIFSVGLIGVGTVYYIIKKYDENQSVRITSQLKSLISTIENELEGQLKPDTALSDEVIFKLSRLSQNTATDFNWYDDEGNLLFSSQPKIFDQGIISTLMNPVAYEELTERKQTQFVHPEHIGKLNYIAAYEVLQNRQNQLLGYISLPFFEKENELKKDVSTFLSALINIYVLLLALAILVTFFIASRITKPLLLIQEKLARINLGKQNEFIEWNAQDEIGELVKEYNKKVKELAVSAEALARSERESAWQEMAKQVAHEIKNPLTPMKLGVQHLLNAYKNNSPDREELLKKISQTLIQQIDTLSNIANEFSNFAQMPRTKNQPLDLNEILSDTINLFKQSPGVRITFNGKEDSRTTNEAASMVFADKDQLLRMFSNLMKNAIQSIPSDRNGLIEVNLCRHHTGEDKENGLAQNATSFKVTIKDNGSGIADNQAEKIFTPNFTTKSGGMGLGLAMAKNIIENSGGKIWFETHIGLGTTFFVTIPAMN